MSRIVIAGAGPAGIAAAIRAAEQSNHVTLIDDNPRPGGQIWRQGAHGTKEKQAFPWLYRLSEAQVDQRFGCSVADVSDSTVLVQSIEGGVEHIPFDKLIIAAGSRELFIPFPGWTLPNVMGAGGVQALYKAGMPVEGKRVVVAGSGPLLFAVAGNLAKAGAQIAAVFEQTALLNLMAFSLGTMRFSPKKLIQGMGYFKYYGPFCYRWSTWIKEARGDDQVREVVLTNGKKDWTVPCDIVACGYNLVANTEIAAMAGCRIENFAVVVDRYQRTSRENVLCAGETCGVGGVDAALLEGDIAGLAATGRESEAMEYIALRQKEQRFVEVLDRCFALRDELRHLPTDDTLICRCEDITWGELKDQSDQRSAKLYTRCGMGSCQGRVCGAALAFLLGWEQNKVQPPIVPATIGELVEI